VTDLAVPGRGEEQLSLWLERTQVRASLGPQGRRSSLASVTGGCCLPIGIGRQRWEARQSCHGKLQSNIVVVCSLPGSAWGKA